MLGIHRGPVHSPHKGPVTRKMCPFEDFIMRLTISHGTSLLSLNFQCHLSVSILDTPCFLSNIPVGSLSYVVHEGSLCPTDKHDYLTDSTKPHNYKKVFLKCQTKDEELFGVSLTWKHPECGHRIQAESSFQIFRNPMPDSVAYTASDLGSGHGHLMITRASFTNII